MFSVKALGIEKLKQKLGSSTIKEPLGKGIAKITLKMEALTKKATVVLFGGLRSGIASEIKPLESRVYAGGTGEKYAEFVEYGTDKMEARHMEAAKVLGTGMFTYAFTKLKEWMGQAMNNIAKGIEIRFGK